MNTQSLRTLAVLIVTCVLFGGGAHGMQKPSGFKVKTDDGYEIAGDIAIPKVAKDKTVPLAIFVHDSNGRRSHFADAQGKFYRAGFASVTFDLRGHGDSEKKDGRVVKLDGDDEWKLMRRDLSGVINYCREQKDIDMERIVIVGAGFGASLALKLATIDEGVKAVICLSCPLAAPYTKDDCSKLVEKLSVKNVPMLMLTGKGDDDKKNAKDIKYYADKANASAKLEIKTQTIDAKGVELLSQKPGIADEMITWIKKNAFDPAKPPAKK